MSKNKAYLNKILSHLKPLTSTLGMGALFCFFIEFVFHTPNCHAKTIYYGSEVEAVTLSYGGPTIFRFNEPVKTISQVSKFNIKPADTTNPNYSVLSVTPIFTRGKTKVSFILANGVVVHVQMVIVSKSIPEKTDSFYDFIPKENLIKKSSEGSNVSDLELMKAMIRRDNVVGYKTRNLWRLVNTTDVQGIHARLVRVYTGSKYNGYVFEIHNRSSKKYAIDLTNLTLGNPSVALLSQVDHKVLGRRNRKNNMTYLRIVSKPSSVYYNISLPISPIKN